MTDDGTATAHAFSLPDCEHCHKRPATVQLVFMYRDEPYAHHFYCVDCADDAWEAGMHHVDEQAARLKEHGL